MTQFMFRILFLVCLIIFSATESSAQTLFVQEKGQEEGQEQPQEQEANKSDESKEKTTDTMQGSGSVNRSDLAINLPINKQNQQRSDLEHYLQQKDINKVLVGPDEHVTLLTLSETTTSKGVLILIPEWQQSAVSPSAIDNLRQIMPAQGWTTITLHPLAKPVDFPSSAINEQARAEANQKAISDYRESLTQLMKAINEETKKYPGIIVVAAQGQSGAQLIDLYEKETIKAPSALVLLSVFMEQDFWQKQAADSLANLGFPILDISLLRDNRYIPSSKHVRKVTVKRMAKSQYRALELINIYPGVYPTNMLDREIKGWLKSNGW